MARLEYFLACESVAIDRDTNSTSIFEVFEELSSPTFPFAIPRLCIVALLRREPGDEEKDWQAQIQIALPGEDAKEFTMNFKFEPASKRQRLVMRFGGIPVNRTGDLLIELRLNGNHCADHLITVRDISPVEQQRLAMAKEIIASAKSVKKK